MSKGVLLVNLGSPDSPSVPDVRRYLREFLMDGRVLDVNWLAHPLVRQIVDARLGAFEHGMWHDLAEFLGGIESPLMRSLITEAVADERQLPNPEIQLADVTKKLRDQFLDQQIATLTQTISSPETADEQKMEFLHEQQRLKQQKRSPLAPLEK